MIVSLMANHLGFGRRQVFRHRFFERFLGGASGARRSMQQQNGSSRVLHPVAVSKHKARRRE